jgi:hypothetical protein
VYVFHPNRATSAAKCACDKGFYCYKNKGLANSWPYFSIASSPKTSLSDIRLEVFVFIFFQIFINF